jgi:ERCC4-type nuclease
MDARRGEPLRIPTAESFESRPTDMKSNKIPKPTVLLVDDREPAEIVRHLRDEVENLTVEVARLEYGDYVLPGYFAIERKATTDFVQSVIGDDKRLFHQAATLTRSGLKPIVLLEGDPYTQDRMAIENVNGMISYLVMKGIYLVFSKHPSHTAEMIAKMTRHFAHGLGYSDPAGVAFAPQDPKLAAAYLLSCIPGVSGVLGHRLIEQFGSVARVCTATEEELVSVSGVGRILATKIMIGLGTKSHAQAKA